MRPKRAPVGVWWLLQPLNRPGRPFQWAECRSRRLALLVAGKLNRLAPAGRAWIADTKATDPKGGTL